MNPLRCLFTFAFVFTGGVLSAHAELIRPGQFATDLRGWWKLDETSGTRLDSSGNGNHLSSINGVGGALDDYWGTGERAADIEKDLSQRLTIAHANQTGLGITGPFTFYCQFKREAASGGGLLRKFDGSTGFYVLVESTGVLRALFNSASGSPDLMASQPLATAKWHDMAFVFDGSQMLLYLNGNLIANRTETRPPQANAADFILGDTFDGLIKDAAIWNRALPPLEVKSLSLGIDLTTAFRPGNITPTPTAYWKLNEPAGTRKNSITGPHPITSAGTAQIDTAQSKFGGAALQLNGSTDYLRAPMANSLNFGAVDFTVEFWVRFAGSTGGSQYAVMVNREANNWNYITCGRAGETWYFALKDNNVIQVNIQEPDALSSNIWYHVAFVRQGSSWKVYRDGQLKGTGVTYAPACPNFVSDVDIGAANGVHNVNGWLDELRISKGIARYTSNFTPPAAPFVTDDQTSLLLHFDGTDGTTSMTDATTAYELDFTDVNMVGSAGGFVEGVGASFNGDYLVIEDSQESNLTFDSQEAALTVAAWVKPSSLGLSTIGVLAKVVSNSDSNGYGMSLHSNGSADFFVGRGGSFGAAQSAANAVKVGTWSHLVGVHDPVANQLRFYVDGKLVATTSHSAGIGNTVGSRFTLGVNAGAVSGADYYSGDASDLAVWNHVLSDADIKALATGLPLQQSGVVSYWPLDEASGSRADALGSNHLSSTNGVGNGAGIVGNAADFEKDNSQFLAIADGAQTGLDITQDLTVIAWAKPESTSALTFLDKNGNNEGFSLNTSVGSAYYLETYGTTVISNTLAGAGAWQHVVGVRDGARKSIWIDSRMETSETQTADMKDTTTDFFLGRHYSMGSRYWDGLLDEVVVAKRWFREEEIKTLYNRGLNGVGAFSRSEIAAPGLVAADQFGFSVAVSGDWAVIGAPYDVSGNNGSRHGAAHVFHRVNGAWQFHQTIPATTGSDKFGQAVAVDGDTIVVGSPKDSSSSFFQGSVSVFARGVDNVWTQQGPKLAASDGGDIDLFGLSLAISGNTLVIGAPDDDGPDYVGNGASGNDAVHDQGMVYVFTRNNGVWTEEAKFNGSDTNGFDYFGQAVAISGSTIAVGGLAGTPTSAASVSAYVFVKTGATWQQRTQQAKLTSSPAGEGATVAASVAIDGELVALGNYYAAVGTAISQGNVTLFRRDGSAWTTEALLTSRAPQGHELFGRSISLSGDTALIGACTTGATGGSATLFRRVGGTWYEYDRLIASDAQPDDRFGFALALAGTEAMIGAPLDDVGGLTDRGSVGVYNIDPAAASVPKIVALSAPTGKPGDSISIFGQGFSTVPGDNIVWFGGVKGTVTAATTTQLTVTVPAGAAYGPITLQTSGRSAVSSAFFTPTFAGGDAIAASSFAAPLSMSNNGAVALIAGDIDGDSKPDLVSVASPIKIYRNLLTAGTLDATQPFPSGSVSPVTLSDAVLSRGALADLDGDGKLDLVVADYLGDSVGVFRNVSTPGSIVFEPRVTFSVDRRPTNVAIRDLDGDGKPEIIVPNSGYQPPTPLGTTISVLQNRCIPGDISGSSFGPKQDFTVGAQPQCLAVADLNGDGKPEVVVGNLASHTISVLRNTSSVGFIDQSLFAADLQFNADNAMEALRLGDFDGDGKIDVVVVGSGKATFLHNKSTGGFINASSFADRIDYASANGPYDCAVGDLSGDGLVDVVLGSSGSSTFGVRQNASPVPGTPPFLFGTQLEFPAGPTPWGLVIVDLDGDGRNDVVTTNYQNGQLNLVRNITMPPVPVPTIASLSATSGRPGDSITITGTNFSTTPGNNIVWFGGVRGVVTAATATQLTVTVPAGAAYGPVSVQVGGRTVAGTQLFAPTFAGDGSMLAANFAQSASRSVPAGRPTFVMAADFDNDGRNDVAVVNFDSAYGPPNQNLDHNVSIYRNMSTPGVLDVSSFAANAVQLIPGLGCHGGATGDLNGDGKADLVTFDYSGSVSLFQNTSTGSGVISFASPVTLSVGSQTVRGIIADFDGDGRVDIVAGDNAGNVVSVFRNRNNGGSLTAGDFTPDIDILTGSGGARRPVSGDWDGDGRLDLVVGQNGPNPDVLTFLRNTGVGPPLSPATFAAGQNIAFGDQVEGIKAVDFDLDGRHDIIAASYYASGTGNTLWVARNSNVPGAILPGGFALHEFPSSTSNAYGMDVGDLNGDGLPDVATCNYNHLALVQNNSVPGVLNASSFAAPQFVTSGSADTVVVVDLDNDGRPDLLTSRDLVGWAYHRNATPFAAPEIVVEQPAGTSIADGSSKDFGTAFPGSSSSSATQTFTVTNTGMADLTGLALTMAGANAGDFPLGTLGSTTLAPNETTTFTVTFTPTAQGARSAVVAIASNDADENPFEINLTGTGTEPPRITFSTSRYSVTQGATSVTLTINRSDSTQPGSVTLNTNDGTSSSVPPFVGAVAGLDYEDVTGADNTVNFAIGESSKAITVVLIPRIGPTSLSNKRLTATLSSPTDGGVLGAITTANIRILVADSIVPGLTVTYPTALMTTISGPFPFVVTGAAGDVNGIDFVTVKLNGGAPVEAVLGASMLNTLIPYSANIEPPDGANTIIVNAYDFQGNTTAITRNFNFTRRELLTLSRTAPVGVLLDTAGTVAMLATPTSSASTLIPTTANANPRTSNIRPGTPLKFTATPKAGYVFSHWTGTPAGAIIVGNILNFNMPPASVPGLTAHFVTNPFTAPVGYGNIFHGLIHASGATPVSNATEGYFTGTLTPTTGVFSGKVLVDGVTQTFALTFYGNGSSLFTVGTAKQGALTFGGKTLTMNFLSGEAVATVVAGAATSTGNAKRTIYSTTNKVPAAMLNVSTTQGYYTLGLPSKAQTPVIGLNTYPQGDGYMFITLSNIGVVSVTGVLADGSALTGSSALVAGNTCPIYMQLTTPGAAATVKGGSFGGILTFDTTQPNSDVRSTDLLWIRPTVTQLAGATVAALATQLYTAGWPNGIRVDGVGAKYDKTATVQASLGLGAPTPAGNARLTLRDGKLTATITKTNFNISGNVVTKIPATDATFVVSATSTNGAITGSFTPNWTSPSATKPGFKGIMIQKGTNKGGYGFFLSNRLSDLDPESGGVTLSAP